MPWAQMSRADVPRGGTVRADVGLTHPLLTELAPTRFAHAGRLPGSAGSEWRDLGWTGVRTGSLSPLLKIQLRIGSLGLRLQEGPVLCVSQGT